MTHPLHYLSELSFPVVASARLQELAHERMELESSRFRSRQYPLIQCVLKHKARRVVTK
jgi:hypothetical protein